MFWFGFACGAFFGAGVATIVISIVTLAKHADERELQQRERLWRRDEPAGDVSIVPDREAYHRDSIYRR